MSKKNLWFIAVLFFDVHLKQWRKRTESGGRRVTILGNHYFITHSLLPFSVIKKINKYSKERKFHLHFQRSRSPHIFIARSTFNIPPLLSLLRITPLSHSLLFSIKASLFLFFPYLPFSKNHCKFLFHIYKYLYILSCFCFFCSSFCFVV